MPSTPLICSSIGVATVSAMTFGLAPGKFARTTTWGGTTSGYSEIGITRSARRPARKISTDSTPAKIGRSMKNLDRFMGRPCGQDQPLEHDPEKWFPVFGKDHAQRFSDIQRLT